LAALGTALGAVLSREAYAIARLAGQRVDAASAAFQRVVAGLLVGGVGLLIVKRREMQIQSVANRGADVAASKNKWRRVWPWVLANSLAGQTIGVSFMQRALETTPTGIVLAIIAVTPVVVIPFSFAFEGERPTLHSLLGGAIAVAGVVCLILS
jgi:drug/metabolite transporter (DMT)-like permease